MDLKGTGQRDGGDVGYTRCMCFRVMLDFMFHLIVVVVRFFDEEVVDSFVILHSQGINRLKSKVIL